MSLRKITDDRETSHGNIHHGRPRIIFVFRNDDIAPPSQRLVKCLSLQLPNDLVDGKWHPIAYRSQALTLTEWNYEIHNWDVLKLHEFVSKRNYTLAIVDVPYGFNLSFYLHEDIAAWMEEEIKTLIQSLKIVSTTRI